MKLYSVGIHLLVANANDDKVVKIQLILQVFNIILITSFEMSFGANIGMHP